MKSKRRLVIISVPFYRIAKVSLSNLVLGKLREKNDVVIVAPFAEEAGFQHNFGGTNTSFLGWKVGPLSGYQEMLYSISETMRMNGFWRRYKKYYISNQYTRFGVDGRDNRLGWLQCFGYWVLSVVGWWPRAWKFVDHLIGTGWCRFPRLIEISRQYDHVTLIQSANWGQQDRALATLSLLHGWRKVMLPYTTDQLDVNGFLINKFDVVCVQGDYELKRAREYHALSESRICRLGSAWFQHLEVIRATIENRPATRQVTREFILYAGVSSLYFRRASEFEAVDAIVSLVSRLKKKYNVIYRPEELDNARRDAIRKRYEGSDVVELQWPSVAASGLAQFSEVSQESALEQTANDLWGCSVVVMSTTTSLALDAAFLSGSGIVANMVDSTGVLRKRKQDLLAHDWFPGLRIADSMTQLLEHVECLLNSPEIAKQEAAQLLTLWDYRDVSFQATLHRAVHGGARQPNHVNEPGAPGRLRLSYATSPLVPEGKSTDWVAVDEKTDFIHQFAIKGLPPGDYTIEAWHEKFPAQTLKVTVGPKETKTADFSFKG